jgi:opacity protein-like surface antigen
MLNGYVEVFDASVAKVFVGAGVGLAQVKEKISLSYTRGDNTLDTISRSAKKKNNFAYSATAGASAELSAGVNGEIAYSWRDFGKTKAAKQADDAVEPSKTALKGHQFIVII